MENASNALIMAAGILISIMLISLGTYLFATFGGYSKNINDTLSQTQIEEFNAQFTKYETTQGDETTYCTAYDIVSVINLAKDENEKRKYEKGTDLYITVTVNNKEVKEELNKFIQDNLEYNGDIQKYKCNVIIDDDAGLVNKIIFNKI